MIKDKQNSVTSIKHKCLFYLVLSKIDLETLIFFHGYFNLWKCKGRSMYENA